VGLLLNSRIFVGSLSWKCFEVVEGSFARIFKIKERLKQQIWWVSQARRLRLRAQIETATSARTRGL
jgi:hypothetical protein